MTARDIWHRAYGYARASKRQHDETVSSIRASSGFWNYRAEWFPWLATLRAHESHAWARLPEDARKAIAP